MTAARILAEKGAHVVTVTPGDTVHAAAQTLTTHKVGAAIVVNEQGGPVGVFSERDLARVIAETGADSLGQAIDRVMSTDLVTAESSVTIDDLMAMMTERRVRHIIIKEGGGMAGVVSIGDVVKRKIASAEAEAESLKAYIEGV